MSLKIQKKIKEERTKGFSINRIFKSFKYSWEGIKYAYLNEQSLSFHGLATIFILIIGVTLDILVNVSFWEWSVIFLSSVVVLALELINTAIEATIDMCTTEFNPYAKIAKDCGSAAAGVAGIAYALICGFIFIDKLLILFGVIN